MTDKPEQAPILTEQIGSTGIIRLNRPQAFNTMTEALNREFREAIKRFSDDSTIAAIIVTGSGKAFCAGLDLKELKANANLAETAGYGPNAPTLKAMSDCPKPLIGAINGFAVTGGLELALGLDFLYAAESAKFADTHAKVGVLPGWGMSQKLPRIIGINRARELSLTGRYFSAQEAKDWGLVNEVLPDEELMPAALNAAERIAEGMPDTVALLKQQINKGWEMSLADGMQYEMSLSEPYNNKIDFDVMEERLAKLKQKARS
jgi:enoyl-CoA hydratase